MRIETCPWSVATPTTLIYYCKWIIILANLSLQDDRALPYLVDSVSWQFPMINEVQVRAFSHVFSWICGFVKIMLCSQAIEL